MGKCHLLCVILQFGLSKNIVDFVSLFLYAYLWGKKAGEDPAWVLLQYDTSFNK